jgi:hypothetical protein
MGLAEEIHAILVDREGGRLIDPDSASNTQVAVLSVFVNNLSKAVMRLAEEVEGLQERLDSPA